MNTEKKTFNIPKENLPKLLTKISFLQRKGKKLGVQVPFFRVVREFSKTEKYNDVTYETDMVEVEVDSFKMSLSGWSFVATIDHSKSGNILRTNPEYKGNLDLVKYRTVAPHCDHCEHQRKRNETFILANEEGTTKQIGRSCLKDFLGHPSAEFYAHICEYVYGLVEESEKGEFSGVRTKMVYSVMGVLEVAALYIRTNGYVSAKFQGERARTSSSVGFWFLTPTNEYRKIMNEEKPSPTEEDKDTAKKAFEMVFSWGEKELRNDFNYNLKTLCSREYVEVKDFGMLCYLPEMLLNTIATQIEEAKKRKAQEEIAKKSQCVGHLKERITLEVDLIKCFYLGSSQFGDSYLYSFSDENGNVIVWKTGKELEINAGTKVSITGTVKEHNEYKGTKQTHLTRCKIEVKESKENIENQ